MPKPFPKRDARARRTPVAATAWERQAGWYDAHQGDRGDDFYQKLILPSVMRRLEAKSKERVLDVCCGQGVLGRALAAIGVRSLGVDASPSLIASARERASAHEAYVVGDARDLTSSVTDRSFDHAALVMALQDVDRMADVLKGTAALVKPWGRLVVVLSHPCFRVPKRSTWGWDETFGMQYRRIDAYLSPNQVPIVINPGKAAAGAAADPRNDSGSTLSFHRPLATYLEAFGRAGFAVTGAEELCSHRRGTKGPRSGAEDIAAKEIPLFLVLAGIRLPERPVDRPAKP